MNEVEKKFLSILSSAIQNHASDIHLSTSQVPAYRGRDGLVPLAMPAITPEEMHIFGQFMLTDPKLKTRLGELRDFDGSFEVKNLGRFRFNLYRSASGISAVLRVIAALVPTIEDLGLPPVLKKISDAPRGLVLVTGATGSGKSSTLAAMINHINENQNLHIVTVEDPVEFLHPQKKSRVSQREIGRDTESFATALKSALRQDPDVILVGEMRDFETLDIALKAAETGHLVFSTVHTSDATKTVGRLISLYPSEQQPLARLRLADNLYSVISQRLVPSVSGKKIVAQEIMITNLGIQECIQNEKKTVEIPTFIEKAREVSGTQTFDQHLADLVHQKRITMEVALEYATNANDFERNFAFGAESEGEEETTDGHGQPKDRTSRLVLDEPSKPMKSPTAAAPTGAPAAKAPGAPPPPAGRAPLPPAPAPVGTRTNASIPKPAAPGVPIPKPVANAPVTSTKIPKPKVA